MNILVVHEVSYASKPVYGFHILPELFVHRGHNVTVVDYDPAATHRVTTEHRTRYSPVTVWHPPTFGLRRLGAALSVIPLLWYLFRLRKFDAVFMYAVPTYGLQTMAVAGWFGVPVLFRSIDVLHALAPKGLRTLTKLLEFAVYRRVDGISALGSRMKDYVVHYGALPKRVALHPVGVDAEVFQPGQRNTQCLAHHGIGPNDAVALFMGTVYDFCGLDAVIQQWPSVLLRAPHAKLLVVGGSGVVERLKAQARQLNLTHAVKFAGWVPYAQLPTYIRSASVCLMPLRNAPATRSIVPNKIVQYLACGKAVVCTPLPGVKASFQHVQSGVYYTELQAFGLVLPNLLHGDPALELNARQTAVAQYNWEVIANRLLGWMQQHVHRRRRHTRL